MIVPCNYCKCMRYRQLFIRSPRVEMILKTGSSALVMTCKRFVLRERFRNILPEDCYRSTEGLVHQRGCVFNTLSPELNPICYFLALLDHRFLHVSRIRVKSLTLRLLMSYIYGAPILDVSRSHTTTQHSR